MTFYEVLNTKFPLVIELAKMYVSSAAYTDSNRAKLGWSLLDRMLNSLYGGDQFNKIDEFNWYYSHEYGSCFQFNSGFNSSKPLKKTFTQGKDYGLYLLIGPLVVFNRYPTSDSNGLIVFVHKSSTAPSSSEGVYIQTGKRTNIIVKKTLTRNYPKPYSNCMRLDTFSSDLYDHILTTGKVYKQRDCFDLCFQKSIIENCKCYYTKHEMLVNNTPACLNLTELFCIRKQAEIFYKDTQNQCELACPLECDSITFDLQTSSLDFPSEQIYSSFRNDKNLEYMQKINGVNVSTFALFKERFLSLNIFYPYMEYTEIYLSPKSNVVDVISNVGGSLGIFLGFSIFFVIELLEIFFHILFILIFTK